MRKLRQLCAAAFLAMVLTTSANAGDIQLPSVTQPPPDQQTSAAGDILCPGATGEIQLPSVTAAEIALTLINVLSVF